MDILNRHAVPGSLLVTDFWKECKTLSNHEDYKQETANHFIIFANVSTGFHTNHIKVPGNGIKTKKSAQNKIEGASLNFPGEGNIKEGFGRVYQGNTRN